MSVALRNRALVLVRSHPATNGKPIAGMVNMAAAETWLSVILIVACFAVVVAPGLV